MTKAQQVRNRRMKAMNQEMKEEAKKVFEWILDVIDQATARNYFPKSIRFCLYDTESTIQALMIKNTEYELFDFLMQHDRKAFFKQLKKIIEQEDGYTTQLDIDAIYWNAKAILLEVVIE